MSFSFDSVPGSPVPSVHADLVQAFQGYDPYARACSATRNSAQLTIPVSPCDKLDEDDFNLWQRALKQSVCHSPLLLLASRRECLSSCLPPFNLKSPDTDSQLIPRCSLGAQTGIPSVHQSTSEFFGGFAVAEQFSSPIIGAGLARVLRCALGFRDGR